jgi:hypothetical protein
VAPGRGVSGRKYDSGVGLWAGIEMADPPVIRRPEIVRVASTTAPQR